VDTHGLSLAERYLEGVKHGNINSRPKLKVLKDRPSTATIDADRGLGAFVATKATELAIKKAKRTGIGAVSLINLTHCGALSYYGLLVTKQKMAAVAFTNSSKIAPPWGGSSRVFGTNPICYTFPSSSARSSSISRRPRARDGRSRSRRGTASRFRWDGRWTGWGILPRTRRRR